MKRSMLYVSHLLKRSSPGWQVVAVLLTCGVMLGLGVQLAVAKDRPSADRSSPEARTSDSLANGAETVQRSASLEAASDSASGSIGAAEAATYRRFLPIIVNIYPTQVVDSAFGLQVYEPEYNEVETIAEAGPSWIHIPLFWSDIEPVDTTPENYQWPTDFGEGLADLSSRNMRIVLTLFSNPSWAATYPSGPIDRTDMADLTEFMVAAVEHYGKPPYNVKYWEIYNEPDNGNPFYATSGWGYFGNDPQAYVDVLSAIYGPMKAADPQAQIVFGGIAYDNWTPTGPFVRSFVDDVLGIMKRQGGTYFDVMNFHYYILFHEQWDAYGPGIIGKHKFLSDKLAEYGFSKPFLCTEASMWSDEAHDGSDELQSRYVVQVFARTMAARLEGTIWFLLRDWSFVGAYKYGLLDSDYHLKPAYYAYQTLSQQLAHAEYLRTLNPATDGSGQIEAYEFLSGGGPLHIIVAWSKDDLSHPMRLSTDQVVMVDRFGVETTLPAGADGRVQIDIGTCSDGDPVRFGVGRCPVYLRFVPRN
jgi:hypothetical protein